MGTEHNRAPLAAVPAAHPIDTLGERIVALAGRLAAATARWLALVAEFDAADGCRRLGLPTTARWLAHTCGLSDRTATDHVRVARCLAAHPVIAEAMAAGRLSYSHVRSISRVVGPDDPELAADLVTAAEHGTVRQLESMVRGLRTVRDTLDGASPPTESISFGWSGTGQWRLSARVDPERGATVEQALRTIADTEEITQAEAFVRLAEIGLAALADSGARRKLRDDERTAVIVHVDTRPAESGSLDGSREPSPADRPLARIADGPGLPASVAERLLCAARIRTAVRDGRDPDADVLNLGRSRRLVSRRQYRALSIRQRGRCAHPGCATRRGLHAHHVRHWIHGGPTNMANLMLLCEPHHLAHHDGEYEIRPAGRGRFTFVRADGAERPEHWDPWRFVPPGAPPIEHEHPDVAARAATTNWRGERLDHDYAVWTLAQRLRPPA